MTPSEAPPSGRPIPTPLCPVCATDLAADLHRCPTCETPHHPSCWDWAGGCAIYGCQGRAAPAAPSPGTTPAAEPAELAMTLAGWRALPPLLWTIHAPLFMCAVVAGIGLAVTRAPASAVMLAVSGTGLFLLHLVALASRFDLERRCVVRQLVLCGMPVATWEIPFARIARLQVDERVPVAPVAAILTGGEPVLLAIGEQAEIAIAAGGAPQTSPAADVRRRLLAGLRQHVPLPVVGALDLDPATCQKRLAAVQERCVRLMGDYQALAIGMTAILAATTIGVAMHGAAPLLDAAAVPAGAAIWWWLERRTRARGAAGRDTTSPDAPVPPAMFVAIEQAFASLAADRRIVALCMGGLIALTGLAMCSSKMPGGWIAIAFTSCVMSGEVLGLWRGIGCAVKVLALRTLEAGEPAAPAPSPTVRPPPPPVIAVAAPPVELPPRPTHAQLLEQLATYPAPDAARRRRAPRVPILPVLLLGIAFALFDLSRVVREQTPRPVTAAAVSLPPGTAMQFVTLEAVPDLSRCPSYWEKDGGHRDDWLLVPLFASAGAAGTTKPCAYVQVRDPRPDTSTSYSEYLETLSEEHRMSEAVLPLPPGQRRFTGMLAPLSSTVRSYFKDPDRTLGGSRSRPPLVLFPRETPPSLAHPLGLLALFAIPALVLGLVWPALARRAKGHQTGDIPPAVAGRPAAFVRRRHPWLARLGGLALLALLVLGREGRYDLSASSDSAVTALPWLLALGLPGIALLTLGVLEAEALIVGEDGLWFRRELSRGWEPLPWDEITSIATTGGSRGVDFTSRLGGRVRLRLPWSRATALARLAGHFVRPLLAKSAREILASGGTVELGALRLSGECIAWRDPRPEKSFQLHPRWVSRIELGADGLTFTSSQGTAPVTASRTGLANAFLAPELLTALVRPASPAAELVWRD